MKIINYLTIMILIFLSACQGETADQASELISDVNKKIEAIKDQVADSQIDQMAQDELEKLFTFEYKVHTFSSMEDKEVIDSELNQLGKDRWECFQIETNATTKQAYCKRRPKTYLRYIPRVF